MDNFDALIAALQVMGAYSTFIACALFLATVIHATIRKEKFSLLDLVFIAIAIAGFIWSFHWIVCR